MEKEAELKKEQFNKTLQLEILNQRKNVAAGEAEASYLEINSEFNEHEQIQLPKEELGPFEKTLIFLTILKHQKNQLRMSLLKPHSKIKIVINLRQRLNPLCLLLELTLFLLLQK